VTPTPQPAPREVSARPIVVPAHQATLLDGVIHERMRLAIVTALALNSYLTFTELKRLLGTTDGNLSVHARRLEEVGYVATEKRSEARPSRTEFRLTTAGRRALERYLDQLNALIDSLRDVQPK
jgi:DNA-binding MarR family transcriptional regulator